MNYEEFALIQKGYPRNIGNDYMMPAEVRKLMNHEKLRCIADEQALFMFEQREGYRKLWFRLRDTNAKLPAKEETVAAYLVYRQDTPPTIAAEWLVSQGFSHAKTLERYTAKGIIGDLSTQGITEATFDETYAMLSEYFSAPEVDMPCRDMFERAICARADDGNLLGVLYMGQTRILAVSPKARGLGIGGKLYRAFAAESKNAIFHEWIRPDNTASIAMFRKLGFTKGDIITDLYIRGNKF